MKRFLSLSEKQNFFHDKFKSHFSFAIGSDDMVFCNMTVIGYDGDNFKDKLNHITRILRNYSEKAQLARRTGNEQFRAPAIAWEKKIKKIPAIKMPICTTDMTSESLMGDQYELIICKVQNYHISRKQKNVVKSHLERLGLVCSKNCKE